MFVNLFPREGQVQGCGSDAVTVGDEVDVEIYVRARVEENAFCVLPPGLIRFLAKVSEELEQVSRRKPQFSIVSGFQS